MAPSLTPALRPKRRVMRISSARIAKGGTVASVLGAGGLVLALLSHGGLARRAGAGLRWHDVGSDCLAVAERRLARRGACAGGRQAELL